MPDFTNTVPPTPVPGGFTYQWERADDNTGLNDAPITGATGSTYTIDPIDTNKFLRVGVYPSVAANPSPTFIYPTTGAVLSGLVMLRGNCPTGTASVQVSVDGDAYRPAAFTGNTWRVSLNTAAYSTGNHTITVRVDGSSSISVAVSFSATTIQPGLQLFKTSDTGYANTSNKTKFSVIEMGQDQNGGLNSGAVDADTQPGRHLLWSHATNMVINTNGGLTIPWSVAVAHPTWLLHELDGTTNKLFLGTQLMNLGNPAYQQAVIDQFLNVIFPRFPGAEGVIQDNIWNNLTQAGGASFEYGTNAAYAAAQLSFVQAFGTAMHAAGYYYGGNILAQDFDQDNNRVYDGQQWTEWMRQLAPYMDGMAEEYYMVYATGQPVRLQGALIQQRFNGNQTYNWQQHTKECELMGVDHLPWQSIDLMTDTMKMTYGKAAFLMNWDPRAGSAHAIAQPFTTYSSTTNIWNTAYTFNTGNPTSSRTEPQPGLFKRTFANGIALMNTNNSGSLLQDTHTLAAGEAYIGA